MIKHLFNLARYAVQNLKTGKRSDKWPEVRKEHLKTEPKCAACGTEEKCQVHHKKPFHLDPKLELEPSNLITLCMRKGFDCHLYIGHGDNFKAFNPDVEKDAKRAQFLVECQNMPQLKRLWAEIKGRRKFELEG